MSRSAAQRSMVRALRYRVLAVVATAMAVMGVASVWGLKIVTDRNAEHQVRVVAQTVMTWGVEDGGVRVVDSTELTSVDAGSTVVALLNADDRVVVATSMLSVTVSDLQVIASRLENRGTLRSDVGSRTILFTEVPLAGEVTLADGTRTPVVRALVGVGVEASDKLVSALALAALGMLLIAVATVAVVTTAVVARTTRALTDLTGRVEHGQLEGLDESPAVEFAETGAIASAIMRLDRQRDDTERQLRDFVADASHELRTPLTKIQGWSELYFQRSADPEFADRAVQSVVDESGRMRLLVDRLAQLARAEIGLQAHEPVELTAICRETVEDAAVMGSDATVVMRGDSTATVLGDAASLAQVVRNLVGNALLHGGPNVTVLLTIEQAAGHVELTVSDDGVGMPETVRERAFERFVTGDRRTGTGLGLAIVQAIVHSHQGTVELASRPRQGTRVTVRLPVAAD